MPNLDLVSEDTTTQYFPPLQQQPVNNYSFLMPIGVLLGLLLITLMLFKGCPGPKPNPIDPDIDVDGIHVMILEDATQHDTLSAPQQGIFTSPEIVEWCDEHCAKIDGQTAFLKIDKEDDLSNMPVILRDMQKHMISNMDKNNLNVPAIGVLTSQGFDVDILPEDKDRTLQYLNSVKGK